tara:strand:+ start:603 stop:1388 length:786 start_codon:yes stop_codon:yes gene_type:complete
MALDFSIKAVRGGSKISPVLEALEQQRMRYGLERKLTFNMMKIFSDIGKTAKYEYQQRESISLTSSIIGGKIRSVLEPHYRTVIENFGVRVFSYKKQESQFEEQIRVFLKTLGFTAIDNISNATRQILIRAITNGQLDGIGPDAISRNILEVMDGDFSRRRAITVARTETHSAASFANHAIAQASNLPDLQKQWVSTSDGRTRSHHASMNGVKIPMDDDFIVPIDGVQYRMSRPSDPRGGAANTINCRCVLIYVEPDDVII